MDRGWKYKNDVLVLEIDVNNWVIASYQRTLYKEIFSKIFKTCEILNIYPLDYVAGYYNKMYDVAMMGKINERSNIGLSSISNPFENYKNSRGNLLNRENVG